MNAEHGAIVSEATEERCWKELGERNGQLTDAKAEIERLRAALDAIVNAQALKGVRDLVAGWNGEKSEWGPYARHPGKLGATLPKTTCGAIYALDEAMQQARALLGADEQKPE